MGVRYLTKKKKDVISLFKSLEKLLGNNWGNDKGNTDDAARQEKKAIWKHFHRVDKRLISWGELLH